MAILALFALLAGACTTADVRLGTTIDCDTEERGRLILFAQAVPTSSAIPCLEELPAGWQIDSIETRSGEAVVVFDNDTHDVDARASLVEACPTSGEGATTGVPGVTLHRTPSGGAAAVFSGGCFDIDLPDVVSADEKAELLDAIKYLTRNELRELTGWTL